MMIGTVAVAGRWRRMRHTSSPLSTGMFRSSSTRSGGCSVHALSAASPLATGFHLDVAAALERVADEIGDVLFVLDDQHPAAAAARHRHRARRRSARVAAAVGGKLGTVSARMVSRGGRAAWACTCMQLTLPIPVFWAVSARLIVGYEVTESRVTPSLHDATGT